MDDKQTIDFSQRLTALFTEFGVTAFGGVLFEGDFPFVLAAHDPTNATHAQHCETLKYALERICSEVFGFQGPEETRIHINL